MIGNYGKKIWLIADCYYPSKSVEGKSHDAACVLNTGKTDAQLILTLYFEDREKMVFESFCRAEKTHHIRMDKLINKQGLTVPTDTPYALMIESSENVVVQYSRLDTSLGGMALMTTIAYPVE